MKIFKVPKFKYDAKTLLIWLWQAWRGNQLQAVLNASVGLLSVGVSLAQVWAVKRAIDVASHVVEGDIYWAVAHGLPDSCRLRPECFFRLDS